MDGVQIKLLSRSDLLIAKKASNRARDINDIENLLGEKP
jgi:hypothetical protein